MGHRQQMNNKEKLDWDSIQYKSSLFSKKGNNFEYWNDENHYKMLDNGWSLFEFEKTGKGQNVIQKKLVTSSITNAKKEVLKLRESGNFARIVLGYEKNAQRVKMFSIIFKAKN